MDAAPDYREIIRVKHEKVPESFFEAFYYCKDEILDLWLISPWIAPLHHQDLTLQRIAKKIRDRQIETNLVTRPPERPWHHDAIKIFAECPTVDIVLVPNLHAKLYIMNSVREQIALLGSANLSDRGYEAVEVGLLVRGRSWGRALIGELLDTAKGIRSTSARQRVKYRYHQLRLD